MEINQRLQKNISGESNKASIYSRKLAEACFKKVFFIALMFFMFFIEVTTSLVSPVPMRTLINNSSQTVKTRSIEATEEDRGEQGCNSFKASFQKNCHY